MVIDEVQKNVFAVHFQRAWKNDHDVFMRKDKLFLSASALITIIVLIGKDWPQVPKPAIEPAHVFTFANVCLLAC